MSLRERFEAFFRTLSGCEHVDDLLRDRDPVGMSRADYLLNDREFIVEQKSIEVDPIGKAQNFISKLCDERGIVAYGNVSSTQIMRRLEDGGRQNVRLHNVVTDRIRKSVSDADKQTSDTRSIFKLPAAHGIVIFLNENVSTLYPDTIAHRISTTLCSTDNNGDLKYKSNEAVMLFSEAHVGKRGLPIITILRGQESSERVKAFCSDITLRWGAFNGLPVRFDRYDGDFRSRR